MGHIRHIGHAKYSGLLSSDTVYTCTWTSAIRRTYYTYRRGLLPPSLQANNTTFSRVLLENPTVNLKTKIFSALHNVRMFVTVPKTARHFKTRFNTILSSCLFHSGFRSKFCVHISALPCFTSTVLVFLQNVITVTDTGSEFAACYYYSTSKGNVKLAYVTVM